MNIKEEALELVDYIDNHAFGYETATKCQAMIRRLVERIEFSERFAFDMNIRAVRAEKAMQTKPFNEEDFNAIAYSYRSWPAHDPKGVSDRYQELLNYLERHGIK